MRRTATPPLRYDLMPDASPLPEGVTLTSAATELLKNSDGAQDMRETLDQVHLFNATYRAGRELVGMIRCPSFMKASDGKICHDLGLGARLWLEACRIDDSDAVRITMLSPEGTFVMDDRFLVSAIVDGTCTVRGARMTAAPSGHEAAARLWFFKVFPDLAMILIAGRKGEKEAGISRIRFESPEGSDP